LQKIYFYRLIKKDMKNGIITLVLLVFSVTCFSASVDTISVYSASMHKDVKCVVITPKVYKTNENKFPVLYLLHGYSGNYADWVTKAPDLLEDVDEAGIIVVCPDGAYNSWYFDSPVDTLMRYETNVAVEIPQYIDEHYRTIADKNARAITGLSMGGHGAMYLAIKRRDIFGAAGSMSGGVDFRPFAENWEIAKWLGDYETNKDVWDKNVVINLVDSLHNKDIAIIFDCGVDDFFIQVNRSLHQKLLDKKIDHDYIERPGVHNWEYWNNSIKYQLVFFTNFFRKNKMM
jgi:S-formylglutathione hydrolase FrmB